MCLQWNNIIKTDIKHVDSKADGRILGGIGFEENGKAVYEHLKMKTSLIYGISLLLALSISMPGMAQQKSPEETKDHTDMVMRKEHHRERVRADKAEKRAAKAEKRINTRAQHKHRRKVRQKGEKSRSRG